MFNHSFVHHFEGENALQRGLLLKILHGEQQYIMTSIKLCFIQTLPVNLYFILKFDFVPLFLMVHVSS